MSGNKLTKLLQDGPAYNLGGVVEVSRASERPDHVRGRTPGPRAAWRRTRWPTGDGYLGGISQAKLIAARYHADRASAAADVTVSTRVGNGEVEHLEDLGFPVWFCRNAVAISEMGNVVNVMTPQPQRCTTSRSKRLATCGSQ